MQISDVPHYRPNFVSLRDLNLTTDYRTSSGDLLELFYIPCLNAAIQYDRAAGYFSSALFSLVGVALSEFAKRGGRMRLVCSPSLTEADIKAIEQGLSWRKVLEENLLKSLDSIISTPRGRKAVELLSALVALKCLEIRIAFKPNSAGIFHDKIGIFRDEIGDAVTFRGSVNESLFGWDYKHNHEGFDVFCSWIGGRETMRVGRHISYFERLWSNREEAIEVFDFPDAVRKRLHEYQSSTSLRELAATISLQDNSQPTRQLMPHQLSVIENWFARGQRGIVKHATGAGKTLTGIEVIRRWLEPGRPALVIVPTEILIDQWKEELYCELGESVAYLQAGGGESKEKWRPLLANFSRLNNSVGARVIITTLDTASSATFLGTLQVGDHLLLVIDEVHRVGAPFYRKILSIQAGGRLGLSATPERYRDTVGTKMIFNYFGGILEPEFSLEDAIRAGRLVPYQYWVHGVHLTQAEQAEWERLSREIAREWAQAAKAEVSEDSGRLNHLLMARSRVMKRATQKVSAAAKILESEYQEGARWLVYCDNKEQLDELHRTLRARKLPSIIYYSDMDSSPEDSLIHFKLHGGIILSIRCLDEGVDIPAAENALLIASSSNLREFIQRRGRVLRKAPGKHLASIHDLLVLPNLQSQKLREQGRLVAPEVRRAKIFAETAMNMSAMQAIEKMFVEFGVLDQDDWDINTEDDFTGA